MKIQNALKLAYKLLDSESKLLDTELLISAITDQSRTALYAHPEQKLTLNELLRFFYYLLQRKRGMPIAYLLKHKEFFGLDFSVNRNVLIPRPDSEILVEHAISLLKESPSFIIEIGTGSACLACAIAKNLATSRIIATDISTKALTVAAKNLAKHHLSKQIELRTSDLLAEIPEYQQADLIIANLPYISTKDYQQLPRTIRKFEPRQALLAGEDGLQFYSKLLMDLTDFKGNIIIEIAGLKQAEQIKVNFPNFKVTILKDLAQNVRGLSLKNLK